MEDCFGYGMGYEIETYNMDLWEVKELMGESAELLPKKVGYKKNFEKYIICEEDGITVKIDSSYGGEVSSPILYDEKSLEESILYVLEILQKNHARNVESKESSASLHFHFGLEAIQNSYQNVYRFMKFMHAFCGEIYEFSHERGGYIRKSIRKYASPYSREELDSLFKKYHHFQEMNKLSWTGRIPPALFFFVAKTHMYRFTHNTLEVRTCNSPLLPTDGNSFDIEMSYEQFMRYFHFYQRILEYITSGEFDLDLINYYYEKERNDPYMFEKEQMSTLKRILKIQD